MTILEAAQQVHKIALSAGHEIVWRETPSGYLGKCTDHRCRINITVDNDGQSKLTLERSLPPCPLNTQP